MKIATWNVNSVRKRLPLLLDWLGRNSPDVLSLQETKVADELFPAADLRAAGYHVFFRGNKARNGVATLTRREPQAVTYGLCDGPDDDDDRILNTVVEGIPVVNTYVPQGFKVGTDNYRYKLMWFRRLRRYFEERLDPSKPAVWLGDLNVAPEPIDVFHPDRRVNDVDFHIDARNAYKETAAWGFADVFRALHPETVQYTYWDYFRNAFQNNWGWRIDHIMATAPLVNACRSVSVDLAPRQAPEPSDHTVVIAEFDLPATR